MEFPVTRSTASPTRFEPPEQLDWIHLRHEETAAFAAGAEAHLTGKLAVCAGSCGPGNLHLINGLYDCHRSRVPVLAIAAQIPSDEIGSGYFQETHPEHLFAQCSHYCELVSQPEQMPRVLEIAMQTAISRRGVAVITLPGDVALRDAVEPGAAPPFSSAETHRVPVRGRDRGAGSDSEQIEEDDDSCGSRLRRSSRGVDRTRGQAESSNRACLARQGVCRVRQPFQCRHDRPSGLFLRLSRHDELRHAADARNRLPVPAVLSARRDHHPDRHSG